MSEFAGVLFADAGDVEDFPAGGVDDAKLSAEVCKSAVGGGFSRFRDFVRFVQPPAEKKKGKPVAYR